MVPLGILLTLETIRVMGDVDPHGTFVGVGKANGAVSEIVILLT